MNTPPSHTKGALSSTRVATFSMLVSVLSAAAFLVGCESSQSVEQKHFTQCFRPKEVEDCAKWKSGHEYCRWFVETYYLDEARGCYGQRWSIPKAYFGEVVGPSTTSESVIIKVRLSDLAPGALVAKKEMQNIWIKPLASGRFKKRALEIKEANTGTLWMEKTDRTMFGMEVYAQRQPSTTKQSYFFFFPKEDPQLLIDIWVQPEWTLEKLPPYYPFKITANVDDRAYVEYLIPSSQMSEVDAVNTRVVELVRSFMVN